jgi:diguanylate cyclase (GGDEF)-like protein/PAS domain S-box-containing protein
MAKMDDPQIFRGVLENLPTGVYLVGRDGKIMFWNYGAERITGHLRQDVVGHACREDFLGSIADIDGENSAAELALEAVLRDGRATEAQVSFRHKAGHLVPVRLRAIPVRDGNGTIVGAAECFDEMIDIGEWDRRHNKLAEYGCLDAASGVLTHGMIQSHLRECLVTFTEHPVPFCILYIALEHQEDVKARYGVGAIAAVLRATGQTLLNSLRPTDFIGRWGENEFLAIVLECRGSEIAKVGERLRKTVMAEKVAWWGDPIPVTISMGAAAVKPGDTPETMMERASEAMQEALLEGGNRILVAAE